MKKSIDKRKIYYLDKKGITLIALVITIIVLLILAGVTIATLTEENGLISRAQEAKEKTESAEMGEKIQTAILAAKTNPQGELTKEGIEEELQKEFENEEIEAILVGKSFIIKIGNKIYKSNGELVEISEIEYAGDLSKGEIYDGLTEETAYRINCIEDLVKWTNSNKGYDGKYIKLERTLDFEDPNSYSNFMNIVTNDINGDGKKEYIITELTTGTGFKPIGSFAGIFDGQVNAIKNIYENRTEDAGLFAGISKGTIKNLTLTGKITSTGGRAAGIAASGYMGTIINCYTNCEIKSNSSEAGGILGGNHSSSDVEKIYNCCVYGSIEGASYVRRNIWRFNGYY